MALPEILNQNFCANYVKMFLLWAKPLSDLAKYRLNVTIHKHDCIYSQKGTVQWKYRQWFWNVFKMQEIISRIRGFAWNADDFSQRYWKADIRKFRHGVHTEIYSVFKVKNQKKFQSGSAKCNWTWKEASLTRRTDAKWLYSTNLDANWNTLTGLCIGVLSPTAIQILYSQFANLFTSKLKRIKLARYL